MSLEEVVEDVGDKELSIQDTNSEEDHSVVQRQKSSRHLRESLIGVKTLDKCIVGNQKTMDVDACVAMDADTSSRIKGQIKAFEITLIRIFTISSLIVIFVILSQTYIILFSK